MSEQLVAEITFWRLEGLLQTGRRICKLTWIVNPTGRIHSINKIFLKGFRWEDGCAVERHFDSLPVGYMG
jgi:hypothetical protein